MPQEAWKATERADADGSWEWFGSRHLALCRGSTGEDGGSLGVARGGRTMVVVDVGGRSSSGGSIDIAFFCSCKRLTSKAPHRKNISQTLDGVDEGYHATCSIFLTEERVARKWLGMAISRVRNNRLKQNQTR